MKKAVVSKTCKPALLILDQMAGPMTWELVEDLGQALGQVALLTGYLDALAKGSKERVQLYPATTYQRGSYTQRALSWLRYVVQAFLWLWRWPRQTPILLYSNPPILPWLGYLMHKLRGQHYAVMVYDIYPDMLVALGVLRENHFASRVWRAFNRRAYENAEVVMTLGEYMAANLERQFDSTRTKAGRVEVVYPWVDTERIRPIPKEENWFAQKHSQIGKFTVMYSGNMGLGHDIETMLMAAQELQSVPEVHFMFIGAGPKWEVVAEVIESKRLANVTLLSWLPEEAIPYSLATADIALVSLENGVEGLSVPSKSVYGLAAGSAVLALAHGEGELRTWLGEVHCGTVIEPGNPKDLASEIQSLLAAKDTLRTSQRNARRAAEQVFARKIQAQQLVQVISEMLPNELSDYAQSGEDAVV